MGAWDLERKGEKTSENHDSEDEARKVKAIGRDRGRGLDLTFDNVQAYAKQWEMRIGCESVMRVGMAGTAVELTDFDQEAVDLGKRRQLINQGRLKEMSLTKDNLLDLLNKPHNRTVGALHWLQILTTYVPELESNKRYIQDMFRTKTPASMRLDRDGVRRTVIHPLATLAKNEATSTDLRDGLVNFLEQIGQTPDDHHPRIVLVGGDGMTFEQLGHLRQMMQCQDKPFKNFKIIQPYLQLWHTEWTDLSRLFTAHFGKEGSHDPSTIGHSSAKINFKRPANLAKIDYYPGSHHLYRILDARILDYWGLGCCVHFPDTKLTLALGYISKRRTYGRTSATLIRPSSLPLRPSSRWHCRSMIIIVPRRQPQSSCLGVNLTLPSCQLVNLGGRRKIQSRNRSQQKLMMQTPNRRRMDQVWMKEMMIWGSGRMQFQLRMNNLMGTIR